HIVGNGAYGDRTKVYSKEQADHSMPYVIAAVLLDDELYPEQFLPGRINQDDVQQLLKKVNVHTKSPLHKPVKLAGILDPYTSAYPEKLMTAVKITLNNGEKFEKEKEDYHGFFTRPFTWGNTVGKFQKLTSGIISEKQQQQIIDIIAELEKR